MVLHFGIVVGLKLLALLVGTWVSLAAHLLDFRMRSSLIETFTIRRGITDHFVSSLHECLLLEQSLLVLLLTLHHHLSVVILLSRIHQVHLNLACIGSRDSRVGCYVCL